MSMICDKSGIKCQVIEELISLARKCEVEKIILFGSRARGDYNEKSDIDLAVYGCREFERFQFEVDESVWTLLSFDIINMDYPNVSSELISEIQRDGVILYEKV